VRIIHALATRRLLYERVTSAVCTAADVTPLLIGRRRRHVLILASVHGDDCYAIGRRCQWRQPWQRPHTIGA